MQPAAQLPTSRDPPVRSEGDAETKPPDVAAGGRLLPLPSDPPPHKLPLLEYISNELGWGLSLGWSRPANRPGEGAMAGFLRVPIFMESFLIFAHALAVDLFLFHFTLLPLRILFSAVTLVISVLRIFFRAITPGFLWSAVFGRSNASAEGKRGAGGGSLFHLTRAGLYDVLKGLIIFTATMVLGMVQVSRVYHYIRGEAIIKLYVIFNILEIVDKLCASVGTDIMDALYRTLRDDRDLETVGNWLHGEGFGSGDGNGEGGGGNGIVRLLKALTSSKASDWKPLLGPVRLLWQVVLAVVYATFHACVIFVQIVCLNVALNSRNNSLLTLLISNNFVELKGSVFKKFEPANLFQIACADAVERFQLALFLSLIILQEGASTNLISAALFIWGAEMVVDTVKHGFVCKFNRLHADLYTTFTAILAHDYVSVRGRIKTSLDPTHACVRRLGLSPIPLCCVLLRVTLTNVHPSWFPRAVTSATGFFALFAMIVCLALAKLALSMVLLAYSSRVINQQRGRLVAAAERAQLAALGGIGGSTGVAAAVKGGGSNSNHKPPHSGQAAEQTASSAQHHHHGRQPQAPHNLRPLAASEPVTRGTTTDSASGGSAISGHQLHEHNHHLSALHGAHGLSDGEGEHEGDDAEVEAYVNRPAPAMPAAPAAEAKTLPAANFPGRQLLPGTVRRLGTGASLSSPASSSVGGSTSAASSAAATPAGELKADFAAKYLVPVAQRAGHNSSKGVLLQKNGSAGSHFSAGPPGGGDVEDEYRLLGEEVGDDDEEEEQELEGLRHGQAALSGSRGPLEPPTGGAALVTTPLLSSRDPHQPPPQPILPQDHAFQRSDLASLPNRPFVITTSRHTHSSHSDGAVNDGHAQGQGAAPPDGSNLSASASHASHDGSANSSADSSLLLSPSGICATPLLSAEHARLSAEYQSRQRMLMMTIVAAPAPAPSSASSSRNSHHRRRRGARDSIKEEGGSSGDDNDDGTEPDKHTRNGSGFDASGDDDFRIRGPRDIGGSVQLAGPSHEDGKATAVPAAATAASPSASSSLSYSSASLLVSTARVDKAVANRSVPIAAAHTATESFGAVHSSSNDGAHPPIAAQGQSFNHTLTHRPPVIKVTASPAHLRVPSSGSANSCGSSGGSNASSSTGGSNPPARLVAKVRMMPAQRPVAVALPAPAPPQLINQDSTTDGQLPATLASFADGRHHRAPDQDEEEEEDTAAAALAAAAMSLPGGLPAGKPLKPSSSAADDEAALLAKMMEVQRYTSYQGKAIPL